MADFDAGRILALNQLIPPAPYFMFYWAPGPDRLRSQNESSIKPTVMRYLRARHAQGETYTILRIFTSDEANGNYSMNLIRAARDYPARRVSAKGGVDCFSVGRPVLVAFGATSRELP